MTTAPDATPTSTVNNVSSPDQVATASKQGIESEQARKILNIYDDYRTACMNKKYYGVRLEKDRRYNKLLEIALAIGASTTIAGWALWRTEVGGQIWGIISGAVIVLSIIKPFLGIVDNIERRGKLYSSWSRVEISLRHIVDAILIEHKITKDMENTIKSIEDVSDELDLQDDPNPDLKLLAKCQDEVETEVAVSRLWIPVDGP